MSIVDLYITIISALFGLYSLACSIESGIALKMLSGDKKVFKLFTPLWEVTNVFLVFGFTGVAVIFSGGLQSISHALLSTLSLAFIALLARACVALMAFYIYKGDIPKLVLWIFTLSCFAIPLSFASAGAYLVTGQLFWNTLLGWVIVISALLGIAAVGLVIVSRWLRQTKHKAVELLYVLWLVGLGSVLPLVVGHTNNSLQKGPIAILTFISFVAICLVLTKYGLNWRKTWLIAPLLIFIAPIVLAWANRPYLISGKLTLTQAYGAQAFSGIFLIGTLIVLPILVIGFWVFAKLLAESTLKV